MFSTEIIIFLISFIILSFSSSLLVRAMSRLSFLFGLSEYITTFIFMSVATSIPELFIGISSVVQGTPNLSLGNILGTNLLTLTLIIGLIAALAGGIRIGSKISIHNFYLIFFIAFLPILLSTDGVISRGDGLLLVLSFAIYLYRLVAERQYFSKQTPAIDGFAKEKTLLGQVFGDITSALTGAALLLGSSFAVVWSAGEIVREANISLLYFGILFVALGTSLPELVFGISAAFSRHQEMMLGNSLGSIAFNATFIVGLTALLRPIPVDFSSIYGISAFLFMAFLLFNLFAYSRSAISRAEGVVLVCIYLLFIVFTL